tara:strand:+ start:104 stop:1231 length:1128 start_codon:yes stop_codon:yes gene_type:complete
MAYSNAGKNTRELQQQMVTLTDDQTISGTKQFKTTIQAAGFYDTQAGKLLSAPALTEIVNDKRNSLFVSNGDGTVRTYGGLVFNGESLKAPAYFGSGVGLTNLQSTSLMGKIPLENLNYGKSLISHNNSLEVNISDGLILDQKGIAIKLAKSSGLRISSEGLDFNPAYAPSKQTVSLTDTLLICDTVADNATKKVTMQQLAKYFQYTLHFTKPHGHHGQLQFNNRGHLGTHPSLAFREDTLYTSNISVQSQLQIGNTFLRSDRVILALPNEPLDNSQLPNNAFSLFLDEEENKLMLRVKYSTGVVRNVSIDLIKRAMVQEEDDEAENEGFMLDEKIIDEEIETIPFEDIESADIEKANSTTGGILGYFKSAFTKK